MNEATSTMSRFFIAAVIVLLAACGGGTEPSEVPHLEGADASGDPFFSGERSYRAYCASCHGPDGRGHGPVADALATPPTDLTQLRARYGGAFEVDSVYAYIDFRQGVLAHGTREMPVWGNVWGEIRGEPTPDAEVDLRIRELVEYIRTLQEEPAGAM